MEGSKGQPAKGRKTKGHWDLSVGMQKQIQIYIQSKVGSEYCVFYLLKIVFNLDQFEN